MTEINYGIILHRSWEITKKSKWLWIYGFLLVTIGGNINYGSGGFSPSSPNQLPGEVPFKLPDDTSRVLGQAVFIFQEWLTGVSPVNWAMLGLGFFLLILFGIIVSWMFHAWAKGSLIAGVEEAEEEQTPTLLSTSPLGIAALKDLIIYGLINTGIFLLAILILAVLILVPALIAIALKNQILTIILAIFGGIIGGLTLVLLFVILAMVNIYAERLIVLYHLSPWEAWKRGLNLSKGNFLPTAVMGIINRAIGCSLGCLAAILFLIILGTPAIIVLIPSFKDGFHLSALPVFIFLFFLLLIFIYANWLVRAIIVVFNYSNWNLLFKEILTKKENGKQS